MKHVILIVLDTLRADHLGMYGYARDTSPHLDRFGRESVVFESAVSLSSWTKPSTVTLLTSMFPAEHRAGKFDSKLDPQWPSLPSVLGDAGFETYGLSANAFISDTFGFAQPFDHFWQFGDETQLESPSDAMLRRVTELIDPDRPQFFYVHLIGPHGPYTPPDWARDLFASEPMPAVERKQRGKFEWYQWENESERQYTMALYDAEIRVEDKAFGDFLRRLDEQGLARDTLLVVTSDHGEAFGEHDNRSHGVTLFHEEIHIPLVLRGPGLSPQRLPWIVGLHDVAPSILRYLRLEVPSAFRGLDVLAGVDPRRAIPLQEFDESKGLFGEGTEEEAWTGIIADGAKAVWTADRTHAFRVWSEDGWDKDIARKEPILAASLETLHGRIIDGSAAAAPTAAIDEATRQRLLSLGYDVGE